MVDLAQRGPGVATEEYRVVGPPGCGKTTWLGKQVSRAVDRGQTVLVASLTRAAAAEVAGRNLPIPREHVGTLHSHCYRSLGMPPIAENRKHLEDWNETHPQYAMSPDGRDVDEDNLDPSTGTRGDDLMSRYKVLRARMATAYPSDVAAFAMAWQEWKDDAGLMDFTDLIEACLTDVPTAPGNPSVLFLDEAQDMDALEMALARKWGRQAGYLVTVGDPDQNLYSWRGSDPEAFTHPVVPESQKMVLSQSYRVPSEVHARAVRWISQVWGREPVEYHPRDAVGEVRRTTGSWKYIEPALGDAEGYLSEGKSVMFLASCSFMLGPLLAVLRRQGIPFHNPYRLKNGAWNPLQSRNGRVSSVDRVLSFLQLSVTGRWTAEDVQRWTAVVQMEGVLPRKGREMVKNLNDDGDQGLPWETLNLVFNEDVMEAGLSGDLDWYRGHLLKAKRKAAEFPMNVVKRQGAETLSKTPQIIVGTVHSVKGGEADVVYLMPDLSPSGMMEWVGSPAQKAGVMRLFYVGMTRARESLVLCNPASSMGASI